MAFLAGLLATGLASLAGFPVPAATLVGGGAGGGAVMLFHTVIGR